MIGRRNFIRILAPLAMPMAVVADGGIAGVLTFKGPEIVKSDRSIFFGSSDVEKSYGTIFELSSSAGEGNEFRISAITGGSSPIEKVGWLLRQLAFTTPLRKFVGKKEAAALTIVAKNVSAEELGVDASEISEFIRKKEERLRAKSDEKNLSGLTSGDKFAVGGMTLLFTLAYIYVRGNDSFSSRRDRLFLKKFGRVRRFTIKMSRGFSVVFGKNKKLGGKLEELFYLSLVVLASYVTSATMLSYDFRYAPYFAAKVGRYSKKVFDGIASGMSKLIPSRFKGNKR